MKKFLVLTLALLLALSIAAPAMAFTSTAPRDKDSIPFELDIYLVDYEDNDFFGLTTLPATDRGYAKNEIVAAIAELFVPEDEDPADEDYGYDTIDFTGNNVNFDVRDNEKPLRTSNVNTDKIKASDYAIDDDAITIDIKSGDLLSTSKDVTYKWLAFAKITGDDASITFGLRTTSTWPDDSNDDDDDDHHHWPHSFNDVSAYGMTGLDVGDYIVDKDDDPDSDGYIYIISEDDTNGDELLKIYVDKKYRATDLKVVIDGGPNDGEYTVVGLKDGVGFIGRSGLLDEDDDDDLIDDLMDIFTDVFEDDFGFDFDLMGNVVDDDFFLDFLGSDDIEVTVEIKPWTAYVSIPDVVVIDPPKTGDAASILGFVMVALAAVAAFTVKKVRA